MDKRQEILRKLPKVDALLRRDELQALSVPRWALLQAVQGAVRQRREAILAGNTTDPRIDLPPICAHALALATSSLRPVINATGVILHTNLGRAPLADGVARHIAELGRGYCNLEFDLDSGKRGSRHVHVQSAVCALTGAEDAVCVNNNAAAVMVCLAALAAGREVIVSRGELVEIGGSFRIPDIMRWSGAELVEVGTTNRTRASDYESAWTDRSALLLKVHQSNFAIVGFTEQVEVAQLAEIGQRRQCTTMMDLGSGALHRELWQPVGVRGEPSVADIIAAGIDVVSFSGDKLLGGPQAGVIVGKKSLIEKVRAHPLMRVVRPDRLTIAALEATLTSYRAFDTGEVPVVRMLRYTQEQLRQEADELFQAIGDDVASCYRVEIGPCESTLGGGAMPGLVLPSWAIVLRPIRQTPGQVLSRLRAHSPPVIGRISEDHVVLDLRTILPEERPLVASAIRWLAEEATS